YCFHNGSIGITESHLLAVVPYGKSHKIMSTLPSGIRFIPSRQSSLYILFSSIYASLPVCTLCGLSFSLCTRSGCSSGVMGSGCLVIHCPSFKFHFANTESCSDCAYLPTLNSAGLTGLFIIIFSTGFGLYFSSVKIGAYLSFVRLTLISSSSNLINAVSWRSIADGLPYHSSMISVIPVISDISANVPM